jgi:hypothetical protein
MSTCRFKTSLCLGLGTSNGREGTPVKADTASEAYVEGMFLPSRKSLWTHCTAKRFVVPIDVFTALVSLQMFASLKASTTLVALETSFFGRTRLLGGGIPGRKGCLETLIEWMHGSNNCLEK